MSRNRLPENKRIPKYVYMRNSAYYFEPKIDSLKALIDGKSCKKLGNSYSEMMSNYSALMLRELDPDEITFPQVVDRYLAEVSTQKAGESLRVDTSRAKLIKEGFANFLPSEIKRRHIYLFVDRLAKSRKNSACNRYLSLISGILQYAVFWGYIDESPCQRMKYKKEEPRKRNISPEEFSAFQNFLDSENPLMAAYINFKYLSGRRGGEILNIKLSQIQPDGIHLTVLKKRNGNTNRIVIWNEDFLQATITLFNSYAVNAINKRTNRDLKREYMPSSKRNDLIKKDQNRELKKSANPIHQTMQIFPVDHPELFFQFCAENPGINLIRNEQGLGYTNSGFGGNFKKLMSKALKQGVINKAFTLHDIRGKTANDSESKEAAQQRLDHEDPKTTQKYYRDKPEIIIPLTPRKEL